MSATVLIVDDNEDNVQILITSLLKRGYEVRIARDGPSALASVRQQRPDVILLDVMMPGMDGMQVLDHLKVDPKTASIPVVMVTAKTRTRTCSPATGAASTTTSPSRSRPARSCTPSASCSAVTRPADRPCGGARRRLDGPLARGAVHHLRGHRGLR